jgi:hypothetical protein
MSTATDTRTTILSSNGHDTYPVRLLDGRAIGCTCKSRQFRPTTACRHMREAEAQAAATQRAGRIDTVKTGLDAVIAASTGRAAQDYRKSRALLDRPTITAAELAQRDRYWDPLSHIDD